MTKTLILGASGQIARHVIDDLAGDDAQQMTLFLRNAAKLGAAPANARVVQGDVLDAAALGAAVRGQDVVYANLTGENLDEQADAVIAAMQAQGVRRLVFVLSLGIHDEVPGKFGEWNDATIGEDLKPFRRAAAAIVASGLDYTILRPAWLTDNDEVEYETTTRNQPFKGTEIARKAVAAYVLTLLENPAKDIGGNIGLSKPGTDGDKPAFM